jgi:hypothetical protein
MEYSGRVNLWLAGGFAMIYAAYLVAGDHWPGWMGRGVFMLFDRVGGAPAFVVGLMVLAAVPAAFQYGLWDHTIQDRCRRLELLLLTDIAPLDYWHAAWAAAWRRGRGYFMVGVILIGSIILSEGGTSEAFVRGAAALASAALLWTLAFTLGFWAFSRGAQANGLGMLLTVGLPFATFALMRSDLSGLAGLTPPGSVFLALTEGPSGWWGLGPILFAGITLFLTHKSLRCCDATLREWYDQNQGKKAE